MSAAPVFKRIAIIGPGLIGGSISHAARAHGLVEAISLWDQNADALARAVEIGLGEGAASLEDAVRDADAVFLCIPVGAIPAVAAIAAPAMKPGAILTDVGSVKGNVAREFAKIARKDIHLIPAHPIAGTEKSGPDAGFAQLFEGRWCLLTPMSDGAEYASAVTRLGDFWRGMGSRVDNIDAQRHDLVLAVTSHIPHLIAYNIVATAHDMESVTEGEVVKYSAAGFRDFTRIAASDPTMWRDVFLNNRDAVLDVLGRFEEDLATLRRAIRNGDGQTLFESFAHSRGIRRSIIEAGQDTAATNFGRDGKKP